MVQPKYNPEEALQRIKLMMKYDSSKTLTENKKVIKEQTGTQTAAVAGGTVGGTAASLGAAYGGSTAGAAVVVPLASALGVTTTVAAGIVGAAAGLAVAPLIYWLVTKDTGANKVKKMFGMCSSESAKIAKLERKLSDGDIRSIADDIEDAVNYKTLGFMAGTDEEKLFASFKKVSDGTASDFCKLVEYYNKNSESGDLFDDLDSDIDAEEEWRQIYRPIRNCVEDSLKNLEETPTPKDEDCKKNPNQKKCRGGGGGGGGYKSCSGTYSYGCKADAISKVQSCLGLSTDGKFGPKTKAALKSKGFDSFTDADIDKICGKSTTKSEYDDYQTSEVEDAGGNAPSSSIKSAPSGVEED